jgi:hypothetical protein
MHETNGNGTCAGHASNGRFTFGNKGGPGRPRRATETNYLAVLTEEVPPETWRAICRRAAHDAKAGDARARDWIARYLLGPPTELLTLDAVAYAEELEKRKGSHEHELVNGRESRN